MGLFDSVVKGIGLPFGLGLGIGEDTMARIPVLNTLTGSQTDAQKRLLQKQQQLAEETKKRATENERARMNALGQQVLAFNPLNQTMAQMFGPEAAFTPQQFANMVTDPYARTQGDFSAAHAESMRTGKPVQGFSATDLQRMEEDKRRRAGVQQGMTPLGPGPAPLKQPPPQPGRRF